MKKIWNQFSLRTLVAQVSNLLCRRFPIGRASGFSGVPRVGSACGLEIRDTADWKSALRGGLALHIVAQVSNLLYRRLPAGGASRSSGALAARGVCGLEIRDTADWKSALRGRAVASALCVLALALLTGCATGDGPSRATHAALRDALLLRASFDGGVDADFAAGDATLYTAPTGNRKQARPGLPDGELVVLARSEGRHGDALRFTKKMKPVVFFRGEKNLGYATNGWSGAVSLWLKLDPDRDLEPGYCDPLQFVAQHWEQGNMFIEFSKDHTPRHFRYAILPVKKLWNPQNRGWEDIPETERPMVPVHRPPFARERWTHVVFCFGNLNTGAKDGWGRLYLDGEPQGQFTGWMGTFNWDVTQSALTLGLNYVGLLDDLAVFNRPLTDGEVKAIHQSPTGMRGVVK